MHQQIVRNLAALEATGDLDGAGRSLMVLIDWLELDTTGSSLISARYWTGSAELSPLPTVGEVRPC